MATTVDRPGTVPATPTGTDPAVATRADRPQAAEALLEIRDLLRTQNGVAGSTGGGAHVAPTDAPEGPGIGGSTKL